jgi:hypothetical protein
VPHSQVHYCNICEKLQRGHFLNMWNHHLLAFTQISHFLAEHHYV